jgi:restriction endonuclease S subunit
LIILDSELVATEFRNQSAGATQKFVSLWVLRKLKVPLPPIEVQEKIIAKIKKERESIEVTDWVGQVFEYTIEKRIKRVWGEPEEF